MTIKLFSHDLAICNCHQNCLTKASRLGSEDYHCHLSTNSSRVSEAVTMVVRAQYLGSDGSYDPNIAILHHRSPTWPDISDIGALHDPRLQ